VRKGTRAGSSTQPADWPAIDDAACSSRPPITLADLVAIFPDDDAARRWLEAIRCNDKRRCPKCGSPRTRRVAHKRPMPYRCIDCRRYFSVRTGTVMQGSNIPLRKWAFGIYALSNRLTGLSSNELRTLGLHSRTTWTLIRKIRRGVFHRDDSNRAKPACERSDRDGSGRAVLPPAHRTPLEATVV